MTIGEYNWSASFQHRNHPNLQYAPDSADESFVIFTDLEDIQSLPLPENYDNEYLVQYVLLAQFPQEIVYFSSKTWQRYPNAVFNLITWCQDRNIPNGLVVIDARNIVGRV